MSDEQTTVQDVRKVEVSSNTSGRSGMAVTFRTGDGDKSFFLEPGQAEMLYFFIEESL